MGSSGQIRLPWQVTRLAAPRAESELGGYLDEATVAAMFADYRRLGGATTWMIDAVRTLGYAPGAVAALTAGFLAAADAGLRHVVVVTTAGTMRMAVSVVQMNAASRVAVVAVGSRVEGVAVLARDP